MNRAAEPWAYGSAGANDYDWVVRLAKRRPSYEANLNPARTLLTLKRRDDQ